MESKKEIYIKIIDAFINNFILPDEKNVTFIRTEDGKFVSGVPMKTDNEILLGISIFIMMQIPNQINIELIREILLDKGIITKQEGSNGSTFYATSKAVNFTFLCDYINSPKTLSSLREFILGEHITKYENMMNVINMTIQNESKSISDAVITANNANHKSTVKELKDYVSVGFSSFADLLKPYDKQIGDKSYSALEEIKSMLNDKFVQ